MKKCSASSALQAVNSSSKILDDLLQNEKAVKTDIVYTVEKSTHISTHIGTLAVVYCFKNTQNN